jgi:hypothetical protein
LLVDPETSIDGQLAEAKRAHPEMAILNALTTVNSGRKGGATTVKLKVNIKDAYDENLYTGMMRELRDNPDTNQLYKGLVKVAIIQGAYQSPVSIVNIIPIEDYSAEIKPIIDSLVSDQDVKAYGEQFLFQKNNFADDTIVPQVMVNFEEMPGVEPIEFGEDLVYFYMSDNFPSQLGLGPNKILLLDPRYNRDELEYDIVKMKRLIEQDGDTIDVFTGTSVVSAMYAIRKAQGDLSLRDVIGYQKVRYTNGDPVLDFDEKGVGRHVYKMVNLLGDGSRASEYYLDARRSVFNNGTVKVEKEISDKVVRDYYEALDLNFREQDEYTPFEEMFVEQPQLPAASNLKDSEAEVRYADKDKRIRIDYPANIETEYTEQVFKTDKLLEIRKVFNNIDDGTINDQRDFGNEYDYLTEYGMTDAEYKYALQNKEVIDNLIYVGEKEWDVQYLSLPDIIDKLLKDNEKLVDTAQLSLFDENKPEGLPAIDRTNETCN